MPRIFPESGRIPHRLLAAVLAVVYSTASVGLPFPVSHSKSAGDSFPCQDRRCGCETAEKCWAGACCCFTMREKVAWANARDLRLPDRAYRLAEEEAASCDGKPECPKCTEKAPRPIRWAHPTLTGTCHGPQDQGLWLVLSDPTVPFPSCGRDLPKPTADRRIVSVLPFSPHSADPPTPPPRLA